MRSEVAAPAGTSLDWSQPISPDGRLVALVVSAQGKNQVWLRPLDSVSARALPGTEGATRVFWSPDSQHVAFFADGNLKEVGIDGQEPRLIVRGPFRDAAWGASGVILAGGQIGRPLMRVSGLGGEPVAETTLDESLGEASHDYPEFLPDGRHYIYLTRGVRADDFVSYVGTLGSKERRPLPGIRAAVKYSPTGHLLFLGSGATLMAQPFDAGRLELSGAAFPVAAQAAGGRTATFSISRNGTLAYISGATSEARLTWFDRTGTQIGPPSPVGIYESSTLSPDGRFVAFDRGAPSTDVWLLELDRAGASRITSDASNDRQPVWSPNGQSLAFMSNRGGSEGIYEHATGRAGDERLLFKSDAPTTLFDWSRDGKYLAYAAGGDVWALPLFGDRTPVQLTTSPVFQETSTMFSPDGHWIAYQSNETSGVTRSGEGDVFVQSFPERGFTRQVSIAGGFAPRWSDDGKELFYVAPDGMLTAVSVTPRESILEFGAPRPLFRPPFNMTPLAVRARFSVSKDGRFLMRVASQELSIAVIVNWFEQLKRVGGPN